MLMNKQKPMIPNNDYTIKNFFLKPMSFPPRLQTQDENNLLFTFAKKAILYLRFTHSLPHQPVYEAGTERKGYKDGGTHTLPWVALRASLPFTPLERTTSQHSQQESTAAQLRMYGSVH